MEVATWAPRIAHTNLRLLVDKQQCISRDPAKWIVYSALILLLTSYLIAVRQIKW